jgi:hypothetical protein
MIIIKNVNYIFESCIVGYPADVASLSEVEVAVLGIETHA